MKEKYQELKKRYQHKIITTKDNIFWIAELMTVLNFDEIWKAEGNSLSSLTKREIAEEMFFKGNAYLLHHLNRFYEVDLNRIQKKLNKIAVEIFCTSQKKEMICEK